MRYLWYRMSHIENWFTMETRCHFSQNIIIIRLLRIRLANPCLYQGNESDILQSARRWWTVIKHVVDYRWQTVC